MQQHEAVTTLRQVTRTKRQGRKAGNKQAKMSKITGIGKVQEDKWPENNGNGPI